MKRPPKRDPLDVFVDFLHAQLVAESTWRNAVHQVALLAATAGYVSPCGVTREDFVVFNPEQRAQFSIYGSDYMPYSRGWAK